MSRATTSGDGLLPTPDIGDELFTFRIQVKTTLVTAIFDSRSQKHLLSSALVVCLRLPTLPLSRPYQFGWLRQEKNLTVDRQYVLRFAITKDFIDTVCCEVVSLDICDVILDAPYLYQRRAVITHFEQTCQLTKDGRRYVLHRQQPLSTATLAPPPPPTTSSPSPPPSIDRSARHSPPCLSARMPKPPLAVPQATTPATVPLPTLILFV